MWQHLPGTQQCSCYYKCELLKAESIISINSVFSWSSFCLSSPKEPEFDKKDQKHSGFRQTVLWRITWELKIDDPMGKLCHWCKKEKDKHNHYKKIKYRMWDHNVTTEVLLEINFLEADC